MGYSNHVTELSAIVDGILPFAGTAGSYLTGAIDMSLYRRLVAYILGGVIGSSGTVDGKWQWSATSGGSYATLTATALVQDVAGSKFHADEVAIEQVYALQPTAKFLKYSLVTAVAATPVGVIVVGFDASYLPVTQGTIAGQIVVGLAG